MLLTTGFALGALTAVFLIVARDFWRLPVARVFLAMVVAGAFVLITPLMEKEWRWLGSSIMTAVPALFWLLCQLAFSHRPKLIPVWIAIALYSVVPPIFVRLFAPDPNSLLHLLCWHVPHYAEYLLTLHGLWTVIANWSDDLVESRRTLRGVILGAVGSVVMVIIVSMNTGNVLVPIPILVGIVAIICGLLLLQGRGDALVGADTPLTQGDLSSSAEAGQAKAQKLQDEDAASNHEWAPYELKLQGLMAEGFYRTEKLTIKALAEALELPEYKTRALINQKLGYRNFNDYINRLRVTEAANRLEDEPDTPVLNISLDVGYRTLSSFNRAFKDQMQCSPSEYRTRQAS